MSPFFERLRREDPVHYCPESEFGPYWSATKFNDIVEAETLHSVFSSEGAISQSTTPLTMTCRCPTSSPWTRIVYDWAMPAEPVTIPIPATDPISGLWQTPPRATACLVLAHGAGAGMTHRSMAATADGLEARCVATLRYQFPYMEKGGKRVDPPPVAHAAVRAAVAEAPRHRPRYDPSRAPG